MPHAPVVLHGIKSCDTCRKARQWLEANGIGYRYHDLRTDGLDAATLEGWISEAGLDAVLNRRSTTWRSLAADIPADPDDAAMRDLMLAHPTLVKRPIFVAGGRTTIGFGPRQCETLLRLVGTTLAPGPGSPAPCPTDQA